MSSQTKIAIVIIVAVVLDASLLSVLSDQSTKVAQEKAALEKRNSALRASIREATLELKGLRDHQNPKESSTVPKTSAP